jgi:hypothetical protein
VNRPDPETAQVRAFLEAGHPALAFGVLLVRRLRTVVAIILAAQLLH